MKNPDLFEFYHEMIFQVRIYIIYFSKTECKGLYFPDENKKKLT